MKNYETHTVAQSAACKASTCLLALGSLMRVLLNNDKDSVVALVEDFARQMSERSWEEYLQT